MEPNETRRAIAEAVEEVLETMCFFSVLASSEGAGEAEASGGAPALTAELRFEGDRSGRFRVGVPMTLARAVGAAFLGREEMEVPDAEAGEVVCELANMICGSALSRLEKQGTFRISHPELAPPEQIVRFEGAGADLRFDLGAGILAVSLELQQAS